MPRLYDFRLSAPTFEVNPFQAVAYDEEPTPVTILSDSIDTLKKEHLEGRKAFDDVQTLFGKTTEQLYQDDPETLKWWSDYKDSINYELNAYLNAGDYTGAVLAASKFGAKAASDPELLGRINSSSLYKAAHDEALKKFKEGTIRDTDLEWFETVQPYKHEDIKDKDGNIIGGTWKQTIALYDDVDWSNIYGGVMKLINPDTTSTSTSSGSQVSNSGPKGGYSRGSSSSRSHSKTVVTAKEINDMAQEIAKDTTLLTRVDQQYEKDKFRIMKLSNDYWSGTLSDSDKKSVKYELDLLKSRVFGKNGDTDLEGYIKRCLQNEVISNGLAYENESTGSSHESNKSTTAPSSGGGGGGGGNGTPIIINTGNTPTQTPTYPTTPNPAPRIVMPSLNGRRYNNVERRDVQDARSNMYGGWY